MAGPEEPMAIPVEPSEEGEEPIPAPKPRKPHEKGIVFRDFDVRQ